MSTTFLLVLAAAQMPGGMSVKDMYNGRSRIARSVEVRQIREVAGERMRYFSSRTRSFLKGAVLADIESWSTMAGRPIKAIYSYRGLRTTVDFGDGWVRFTTVPPDPGGPRVFPLPADRAVVLSQFDPLLLTQNRKLKSIPCTVVVPEEMQIGDAVLEYVGPVPADERAGLPEGDEFAFVGAGGRAQILLDKAGNFERYLDRKGIEVRLDAWRPGDSALFGLPDPVNAPAHG